MASSAKKVIDNIVEFIEIKTEQIKLRIIARVARMLSGVIAVSMIGLFAMFFIFFLSFAFAEMINHGLDSTYLGYLIIAGAYLLIIILVLLLVKSRKLQRWIEVAIVKMEEARYEQERNN
ncbi:Putative Holin-X, holin superfamily III [Ekhidna lutea]|uniref:Putative Holin-X, holin superfamily III n=1 Tax=Ekhidna lutea TaxID=447679 RepID=A0A239KMI5_EKHLU|nr:phage holin family protein [Ekhidna lutea]SNT19607.1 Putative Holin-X, holin superfamily III [Ekhidna lutea]